jgi:hypothetical protein
VSIITAANNDAVRTAITAARSGSNTDITSLAGLTTALSVAQGGTGATTAGGARGALDVPSTGAVAADIAAAVAGVLVPQIQPLTATVAGNDLILSLAPTKLDFRSATPGSGTVVTRTTVAPVTLTIPNGATLGLSNGVSARLQVKAIDNAGTVELAVSNPKGTIPDESLLLTTVAVSTGSDSDVTEYSANARTNVAFRSVGFIDISEAAAGVWATAPTVVQGAGGLSNRPNARTYQVLTGSRAYATDYVNTTRNDIHVYVTGTSAVGTQTFTLLIDGATIGTISSSDGNGGQFRPHMHFIVPPGATYRINATGGALSIWTEFR